MSREDYLFHQADWFSVKENQKVQMNAAIDKIGGDRLLNSSVADLCDYFEQEYRIDVPVLREDQIVADQHETLVDVSRDPYRYISDRSRPFQIQGTTIQVTVPFTGDAAAFRIRPTTYTTVLPRATVRENSLIITVTGTNLNTDQVRAELDRNLGGIKQHLEWLRADAKGLNEQLRSLAHDRIEMRRKKLLADQNLVADLGFPLKVRNDAPKTYAAPEVRRRITPTMPKASTAPYAPEPTLSMDDYEHILSVIANMTLVMERSPSAFFSINEEALRSHFLVQLNGHYEGQATGETFNYEGKTDILIRSNGKNIFIGECKYWDGPKMLSSTVDQILSYTSWRDTKVAIILFNRNKKFSQVLGAIPGVLMAHPSYKRDLGQPSETTFRYVFAHRDDPNRELILTVMAFDVPQAQAAA